MIEVVELNKKNKEIIELLVKAMQNKWTFPYGNSNVNLQDLFSIPQVVSNTNQYDLNSIASELDEKVNKKKRVFTKSKGVDADFIITQGKLTLVQWVISVKDQQDEDRKKKIQLNQENQQKRQDLLRALNAKQHEKYSEMSIEEIQKELNKL